MDVFDSLYIPCYRMNKGRDHKDKYIIRSVKYVLVVHILV